MFYIYLIVKKNNHDYGGGYQNKVQRYKLSLRISYVISKYFHTVLNVKKKKS